MPGEPTMETYLGRVFNHGGVMVNLFSWGIGGDAMRSNFFRQATESDECLAAYRRFLSGASLVESAPMEFSVTSLQAKMRRIQELLPAAASKSGEKARLMMLTQMLEAHMKAQEWQDADRAADAILSLVLGVESSARG